MDIQLNFINNSNDQNNSQVVIFQKNTGIIGLSTQSSVVAWNVFPLGTNGNVHPVTYPLSMSVAASDSFGDFTAQIPASSGNRFDMISSPSGNRLQLNSASATNAQAVELHNELPTGSINANIYKGGLLLATKTGIAPGQMAQFIFGPTLYIHLLNTAILQGAVMNLTALSDGIVEISLLGIKSADVVVTGGGAGPTSLPFQFTLQNVKYA